MNGKVLQILDLDKGILNTWQTDLDGTPTGKAEKKEVNFEVTEMDAICIKEGRKSRYYNITQKIGSMYRIEPIKPEPRMMRVVYYYNLYDDRKGTEVGIPSQVVQTDSLSDIIEHWEIVKKSRKIEQGKQLIHVDITPDCEEEI